MRKIFVLMLLCVVPLACITAQTEENFEEHLLEARSLLEQGEVEKAKHAYELYKELTQTSDEVLEKRFFPSGSDSVSAAGLELTAYERREFNNAVINRYNGYYAEAFAIFMKFAERGHVRSQMYVGEAYAQGKGVDVDYEKAVEWYEPAAEHGDKDAQYNLAVCYQKNHAKQNHEKAVEWYLKLANEGNLKAQSNLGSCFEHGWGVERDMNMAFTWYKKAAEGGDAQAQYNLGVLYYNGQGVLEDMDAAKEWFTKSAQQGFRPAQSVLESAF